MDVVSCLYGVRIKGGSICDNQIVNKHLQSFISDILLDWSYLISSERDHVNFLLLKWCNSKLFTIQ